MYYQVYCELCGSQSHFTEACLILVDKSQESAFEDGNFMGWDQGNSFISGSQNVAETSNLEMMVAELLAQQKESNAKLDNLTKTVEQLSIQSRILENQVAQQTRERELRTFTDDEEGCSNIEVLESFEDQFQDNTFDVLGQAIEGKLDEEDSAMEDDSLGAFPTQSTCDDLDSLFGDLIEEDHLEPIGSHTHEDLVKDSDADLSDVPLYPQESACLEEVFELEESENTFKCIEEWTPIILGSNYEDPYLLMPPPSNFWCFQPFFATYEDPFLFAPPPNKFWSFQCFNAKSFGRNSYDPSASVETYFSKGSTAQVGVRRRLDGRKYIWDLKVV